MRQDIDRLIDGLRGIEKANTATAASFERIVGTLEDLCQLALRLTVAVELNTIDKLAERGIEVVSDVPGHDSVSRPEPDDATENIPKEELYRFGELLGSYRRHAE